MVTVKIPREKFAQKLESVRTEMSGLITQNGEAAGVQFGKVQFRGIGVEMKYEYAPNTETAQVTVTKTPILLSIASAEDHVRGWLSR